VKGKRILFATGDSPEIFAKNVQAKGVDLTKLDFVVRSRRHGDPMGGMTYLLSVNSKVKIYAPKETFGIYGFDLPSMRRPKHRRQTRALLLNPIGIVVVRFNVLDKEVSQATTRFINS